jgi:acyl-ACP thioesterase
MYKFNDRVKMSQTDKHRNLTIPAIIDAMQNCVIFQLEDLGVGLDYFEKENKALVVSCWQVQIYKIPRLFDRISLATQVYGFKSATGFRHCMIYDESGNLCVASNSIGVFINPQTGRPMKVAHDEWVKYDVNKGLDILFKDRHIPFPTDFEVVEQFDVNIHHLDSNNHMNNAQYVRIAYNYLPDDFEVSDFRVEYKKPAMLGDSIYVRLSDFSNLSHSVLNTNTSSPSSKTVCIVMCDAEGTAFAVVEFTGNII